MPTNTVDKASREGQPVDYSLGSQSSLGFQLQINSAKVKPMRVVYKETDFRYPDPLSQLSLFPVPLL